MPFRRALMVLALLLPCSAVAGAQIVSEQKIGDKTVSCVRSGLSSDLKDCGLQSDLYAYVFVGSVAAISPIANDEQELQIVPGEIFLGHPQSVLTVVTSQGLCLPGMVVGSRWLFYLRSEAGKPIVLDYYANDSRPIEDAQAQLATLRRLRKIGNAAILRGQIDRGQSEPGQSEPSRASAHKTAHPIVFATRRSDRKRFSAMTNGDGRFELPALLPGLYELTVAPLGSQQPDRSSIDLKAGTCRDLTLFRSPHARIAGQVRHADGSPLADVDLVLLSADNSLYRTTQTDPNGNFSFDSQAAGDYVLGLNFPARRDWFNGAGGGAGVNVPPASTFYPGVPDRANARVIRLAPDQKLDRLDFTVP